MKNITVNCENIEISNNKNICLIAGPCQLETEQHAMDMAGQIKEITSKFKMGFIYKTSFDKANRTSLSGKRGAGLEQSLPIFDKIKKQLNLPILTDIHNAEQCSIISKHVDILQIPAFLCRQTDLLIAAAKTKKPINIKKGQFVSPTEISNILSKIKNNNKVLLTERGYRFGYNNLISDMRSLAIMKKTKFPVIFDATHSVQQPGGLLKSSGGQREFVSVLAKAAVSVGIAGILIETHNNPNKAPSDGPCMLTIKDLKILVEKLIELDFVNKNN